MLQLTMQAPLQGLSQESMQPGVFKLSNFAALTSSAVQASLTTSMEQTSLMAPRTATAKTRMAMAPLWQGSLVRWGTTALECQA